MQRTVKATVFTYAKTNLNPDGTVSAEIAKIEVPEIDEKKALKKAFKEVGTFTPLKSEITETLYILSDEIFFRYAVKADDLKNEKEESEEKQG